MNSFFDEIGVEKPIIQAGMVWCSGSKLAVAVCKSGALGCVGAGSMPPEVLKEHLTAMQQAKVGTYAVNLPLFYHRIEEQLDLIEHFKVPVVITSAGSPALYTDRLKAIGCRVIHVVSSLKFALKAQAAGVDAVVAEGFEAGGHNGREENTSWVLAELLRNKLSIPFILAGGMYSGASLAAAKCFGASGIQVGSRFAVCVESSAHAVYKQKVVEAREGDTALILKELMPVRLLKTHFYEDIQSAYEHHADASTLQKLLGKGRSKSGIFEGDLEQGELEIGQISARIEAVETAQEIVDSIYTDYLNILGKRMEG
jgi:enoyl-[acyl-carrier protein] reductase II